MLEKPINLRPGINHISLLCMTLGIQVTIYQFATSSANPIFLDNRKVDDQEITKFKLLLLD